MSKDKSVLLFNLGGFPTWLGQPRDQSFIALNLKQYKKKMAQSALAFVNLLITCKQLNVEI